MTRSNVLFVVWDTARAWTVHQMLQTGSLPWLQRLASEGVRFERAISQSPWTLPSHASMFTGQYPGDHGTDADSPTFEPSTPPLAERLSNAGYLTAGISGNPWVSPEFGFDRGFDDFSMGWDLFWNGTDLTGARGADSLPEAIRTLMAEMSLGSAPKTMLNAVYNRYLHGRRDDGARMTTRRSVRWLQRYASTDRPFFLFLNYIEPHLKYEPPPGVRDRFLPEFVSERRLAEINQDPWRYVTGVESMDDEDFDLLESLYRAEIAYVDRHLGRLYRCLEDNDLLENTLVILVSDHGENIGDHGLMDHQYGVYNTLTHVPLVIRPPTGTCAGEPGVEGESVQDVVELRNLSATIVEATLGPDPAKRDPGSSVMGSDATRGHAVSEYLVPQPAVSTLEEQYDVDDLSHLDRIYRALWDGEWKLVEVSTGDHELYDVREDPHEGTDLADDRPDVAMEMVERLTAIRGKLAAQPTDDREDVSVSTEQRLEDLGYL